MRPQWFSVNSGGSQTNVDSCSYDTSEIPFDQMWEDDRFWMPLLLAKQPFAGRADFKKEGEIFSPKKWWFGVPGDSDHEMPSR